MKHVLFVQLPPPRFVFEEAPTNIPLAAGFLVSALRDAGIRDTQCEIAGAEVVDLLCDRGIEEWIASRQPGAVAFSLYVWNVQRSLFLAAAVKRRLPDVRILVGGPEVTPDNTWVQAHPAVDGGVFGEGESRIKAVVEAASIGKPLADIPGTFRKSPEGLRANEERVKPRDLSLCRYPYLDGTIGPSADGTLFVETLRGCPFRCRYCYYHKAFGSVRRHPVSTVQEVLRGAYGEGSGVREIYLMDPTFNAHPGFSKLLRYMASQRRGEYPKLHTELRADLLTADHVKLLGDAGLASAEIGLQTTNPDALNLAGRTGSPENTARGVALLKDAGIEVTTGIILGLPGDSPRGFSATLKWLRDTEAYSVVHPFVLSVLPGTDFRARAGELGLNHHRRPPYYVRSTGSFGPDDLRSALLECEDTFGIEMDAIAPPSLVDRGKAVIRRPGDADYVSKWIVNLDSVMPSRIPGSLLSKATDPFTFWFRGRRLEDSETAALGMLNDFAEANPHAVVHVVLEFDTLPGKTFFDKAVGVSSYPGSYLNRLYRPLYGEGAVVTPVFQIIWPDPGLSRVRETVQAAYGSAVTVVWDQVEVHLERLLNAEAPLLISWSESESGYRKDEIFRILYEIGNAYPEEIRFRDPLLQDHWERLTRKRQPAAMPAESILVTE
ncbi:MAG: radical SAM protein [Pseudomonadota bacterium]